MLRAHVLWPGKRLWIAYYGYFAFLAIMLALTFMA